MDAENADQLPSADECLEQAYVLEEQGDYAGALFECDAAIQQGQSFLASAYNLRGIILEELGRNEEALEAYQTALDAEPGFEDAMENLEELQSELGISDEPVTIATFGSVGDAHVAKGRLEADGIPAFVLDEYAASTFGLGQTGGIRLQVRGSDVDRAVQILGLEEDEEEELICPLCGSRNVRVPLFGKEWHCKDCDNRWTP
jgi:tetratricopeptide (TPR) repeat protein